MPASVSTNYGDGALNYLQVKCTVTVTPVTPAKIAANRRLVSMGSAKGDLGACGFREGLWYARGNWVNHGIARGNELPRRVSAGPAVTIANEPNQK
jgi:hypothetical protein